MIATAWNLIVLHRLSRPVGIALVFGACLTPARADVYPVSGRWTYENALAPGPAPSCRGRRHMDFLAERRFDTGGGVPDFRNVRVLTTGGAYYITDQFLTAQARGRTSFWLVILDDDHIRIQLEPSGRIFVLRRCA